MYDRLYIALEDSRVSGRPGLVVEVQMNPVNFAAARDGRAFIRSVLFDAFHKIEQKLDEAGDLGK